MKAKLVSKILAALLAAASLTCSGSLCALAAEGDPIIVGSKDFTESIIIGEIYALALEDAGLPVERQLQIGSQIIHDAIMNDEIDVYPEYTGTGLIDRLKADPIYDPEECYEAVKAGYEEEFGLIWLEHSEVNDAEGLAVTKEISEEYGITTISDAWEHASDLVLAGSGEFYEAPTTYARLMEVYGEVTFKEETTMDHTLSFTAAKSGDVDVISVYTSEGNLADDTFVILEDDKQCWPPYYLAPVMREDTLAAYPEAEEILNKITASLTTETVIAMNAAVDLEGEDFEDVAYDYYESIKDEL